MIQLAEDLGQHVGVKRACAALDVPRSSLDGCEVEITLDIDARYGEGFDGTIQRTITENSNTLKFKWHGFEE